MNEFVSWCRHLLVSFLFHALTSLHPPSFHRNDFSTCSTHFSFILPKMFSLRSAHVDFMYAHAHAENLSTLEMFGEKISASPGSSKEIADLLRKMMMMMMMMMKMTRKL